MHGSSNPPLCSGFLGINLSPPFSFSCHSSDSLSQLAVLRAWRLRLAVSTEATRRVSDSLPDPTRRGADSLASKCGPVFFFFLPFPLILEPTYFSLHSSLTKARSRHGRVDTWGKSLVPLSVHSRDCAGWAKGSKADEGDVLPGPRLHVWWASAPGRQGALLWGLVSSALSPRTHCISTSVPHCLGAPHRLAA